MHFVEIFTDVNPMPYAPCWKATFVHETESLVLQHTFFAGPDKAEARAVAWEALELLLSEPPLINLRSREEWSCFLSIERGN